MGLICSLMVANGAESKVARAKRFKMMACVTLACGAVSTTLIIAMHVWLEELAEACVKECSRKDDGDDKQEGCVAACPSTGTAWIAWFVPAVRALAASRHCVTFISISSIICPLTLTGHDTAQLFLLRCCLYFYWAAKLDREARDELSQLLNAGNANSYSDPEMATSVAQPQQTRL